ncbi:hypothetical protein NK8_64360 (plasmid) [Caballeronia sp. NK8]|uniref:TnsD family Tn7-like transposition protein n=1 Tax=Caballeronia sp. NK8 TaxID=140098 RepID=UPI001BB551E1|nr:TnsD family Tn7-like transposition protein [Caballeronia sp. NK8]BCQ28247.1 hypothetical protein NK8_64360 [Caballeronia sp. NK8]
MTVALPVPYDDELLFSAIARYFASVAVLNNYSNCYPVMQGLFERSSAPKADLLFNLSRVASETSAAWRLSAKEIAYHHTLLPYFLSYLPSEKQEAVLNAAFGTGIPTSYALLGHFNSAVKRVSLLRVCPACIQEDRQRCGEGYWRRAHQLPGVFACVKHNLPLRVTPVNVDCDGGKVIWTTAEHAFKESAPAVSDLGKDWLKDDTLMKVMKASVKLLYEPPGNYGKTSYENYLARAEQAGFVNIRGWLKTEAFSASATGWFNAGYLKKVGLSTGKWAVRMLTCEAKKQVFQPLEHVLLEHFFDGIESSNQALAHRLRPPPSEDVAVCPNRLAAHRRGHRMDHVAIKYNADGSFVGTGRCACGVSIRFSRFKRGTREPVIDRFYSLGEHPRNAIIKLRDEGASLGSISDRLDVPKAKIQHVIYTNTAKAKRLRSYAGISPRYIRSLRKEWMDILNSVDGAQAGLARQQSPQIYEILRRHDARWLIDVTESNTLDRNDDRWRERDELSVSALIEAKERLLSAKPPIRATRNAMTREVGVCWYLFNAGRMPRGAAALEQLEESWEEFRIRRLWIAAQNIVQRGLPRTRAKVLHLASVRLKDVTPAIESVVDQIIGGFAGDAGPSEAPSSCVLPTASNTCPATQGAASDYRLPRLRKHRTA